MQMRKNCTFSNILQKVKSYFFANIYYSPFDSCWNSKKSIKLKPSNVHPQVDAGEGIQQHGSQLITFKNLFFREGSTTPSSASMLCGLSLGQWWYCWGTCTFPSECGRRSSVAWITVNNLYICVLQGGFYYSFFCFYTLWFISGPVVILEGNMCFPKWVREKVVRGVDHC